MPPDTIFSKLFNEKSSLGEDRRPKEKWQDFLTNVTETVPFMDPLYYSPQESFNDFMKERPQPMNVGEEFLPADSDYQRDRSKMTDMWIKDEGLMDLWKKAGKPRIADTGNPFSRGHYFDPELSMYKQHKGEWKHRKDINPLSHMVGKVKRAFKSPFVVTGSKETLVSELAHAVEHRNPEVHNYYTSKEEMTQAVKKEREDTDWDKGERGMYDTPGTVEHHTHSITEPKLIDYLIKNYTHPVRGDEIYEAVDWDNYGRKYEN